MAYLSPKAQITTPRPTQSCIPLGQENLVSACLAEVKGSHVHLCQGQGARTASDAIWQMMLHSSEMGLAKKA